MARVRTYPAGVTSWIELGTGDIEATKAFYGQLFGWTFVDVADGYVIAQLDADDVAGIAYPAAASWSTYVAVADAQATVRLVEDAGGRVLSPASAGEAGVAATCADPSGVEFRLWQANQRLGAQVTNAPGSWNFSDLHSADPAVSIAFYSAVFGWSFDDLGFATMIRRPGYGDHLASTVDPGIFARQAEVSAPPGFADAIGWLSSADANETPHWHVTFTVADRDKVVTVATGLGATVLTTADTDWTKAAQLRDLQGAEFTASQFTPPAA